ncbi:carbohydrate binding domain-containing protein [Paenibacillus assamensis]|uniref:carbohydrate binding domain-containing protein n=1 Tax=Paenibacillus assamensis TaxID=311244 RepID=UPI00041A6F43|nr:carbohydrate binding domain-containing protein [Paenibacillus assamensis]
MKNRIIVSLIAVVLLVSCTSMEVFAAATATKQYFYDDAGKLRYAKYKNQVTKYQYDQNGNVNRKFTDEHLIDGGFELVNSQGTLKAWNYYMGAGIQGKQEVDTSLLEGTRAMKLEATSIPRTNDGMNVWQDFSVTGNTTYTLSGKMRMANVQNTKLEYLIYYYDKDNNQFGGEMVLGYDSTTDWVTFSKQFVTPANATRARIHAHLSSTVAGGKGTVHLDMLSVKRNKPINLLTNGDFEIVSRTDGTADGWSRYVGAVEGKHEISQVVTSEGLRAQKIAADNILNVLDGINIWQDFFVSEQKPHVMHGRVRLEQMKDSKLGFILYYYDKNNKQIGSESPLELVNNNDWLTVSARFTPPAQAIKARLHIHVSATKANGQGTVYVDAMSIQPGDKQKLLFNGNFESASGSDGAADGWFRYVGEGIKGSHEISRNIVKSGKRAQKIVASSMPRAGDGINIWQDFLVPPQASYLLTGALKLENMKDANLQFIMYYYDRNNNAIGSWNVASYAKNGDWLSISESFKPPANTHKVRIHVHLSSSSNNGQGTVYVDDLSIS